MSDPAELKQPEADLVQKMSQPIDTSATYEISGQAIVGIMQLVDEVPMKYARALLPAIVGALEKVEN